MDKPMDPDRLAYLRGIGDDELPAFWLVQIRDLLADRDRLAQQHEEIQAKLRAMSERWHEQAHQCWWGKEKSCGDHDDGRGDGLDTCADELDELLGIGAS